MRYLIVSRHPAAIAFLRGYAPAWRDAPVKEQATAEDVRGAVVAGNLPMHLACLASEVHAIEFENPPRGAEYTADDMRAAGARVAVYRVRLVPDPDDEPSAVMTGWSGTLASDGK